MKTLRKVDLESMQKELQVLKQEDEKSILGGAVNVITDPNDVPQSIWDIASGYVDDSGNWLGGSGSGSESGSNSGNYNDKSWEKNFKNEGELRNYLCDWVHGDNYVEVIYFTFADGSSTVFWEDSFTKYNAHKVFNGNGFQKDKHGNRYYNGKRIISQGHTQHNSYKPSEDDLNDKDNHKYWNHEIFYDGIFYEY